MKTVEYVFNADSRSAQFKFYALGDIHVGALNCAEHEFMRLVRTIANDDNARWIGGGDMLDAVIIQDAKRFDINSLPDWMVTGSAKSVKAMVGDIIAAQKRRFLHMVKPIKDKCLGLIEGNHEYSIFKHHNRDVMAELCNAMEVPNLTDCTFMRLKFKRHTVGTPQVAVVTVFACHGHSAGRSSGAEPNNLFKLSADKHADIVLTGHSHTFNIHPPIPIMRLPANGKLLAEPIVREKYAANWGSYMLTYKDGPSTYASRANYPIRPMYTVETTITPFRTIAYKCAKEDLSDAQISCPEIEMRQLKL